MTKQWDPTRRRTGRRPKSCRDCVVCSSRGAGGGEGMEGGFPDALDDLIAVGVVLGGDVTDEHGQGTGEDAGWQHPQWKRRVQVD